MNNKMFFKETIVIKSKDIFGMAFVAGCGFIAAKTSCLVVAKLLERVVKKLDKKVKEAETNDE